MSVLSLSSADAIISQFLPVEAVREPTLQRKNDSKVLLRIYGSMSKNIGGLPRPYIKIWRKSKGANSLHLRTRISVCSESSVYNVHTSGEAGDSKRCKPQ
jgi:hypothetical protein